MAKPRCAAPRCARLSVSLGWCSAHYQRVREFGDPQLDVPLRKRKGPRFGSATCDQCGVEYMRRAHQQRFCCEPCGYAWRKVNNPLCIVPGCKLVAMRDRMCGTHSSRWRDGRDVTAPVKRRLPAHTPCEVPGCIAMNKHSGLCAAHWARLQKHGDVQAHIPVRRLAQRGIGYVDSNGYRSIAGRKEHRIVMEAKLGRRLRDDETVHHINGDRLDNRPENLELWVVRRQPPGQRVSDRIADAIEMLERYAPEVLAPTDIQLRAVA